PLTRSLRSRPLPPGERCTPRLRQASGRLRRRDRMHAAGAHAAGMLRDAVRAAARHRMMRAVHAVHAAAVHATMAGHRMAHAVARAGRDGAVAIARAAIAEAALSIAAHAVA